MSATDSTGSARVEGRPSPAGGPTAAVPTAAGNDIALTTFTPVAWWGFYLPVLLRFVQATGATLAPLEQLSFINAAQWSIVARFPSNGAPQGPDPGRWPQMIFESNFNGTWEQYIDAFAEVMTLNFKAFWGSSPGFPGPMPTGPFKAWIRAHETEASHYYCAYPSATATTIRSALALQEALARFARDSAAMDAASFREAYDRLLTEVQRDL